MIGGVGEQARRISSTSYRIAKGQEFHLAHCTVPSFAQPKPRPEQKHQSNRGRQPIQCKNPPIWTWMRAFWVYHDMNIYTTLTTYPPYLPPSRSKKEKKDESYIH